MAKKVVGKIGLQIPAGKATPAPPIGPALGPYSLNIMDFCKQYNERTSSQAGMIIPVEITVFEDRTFAFITKTPPASFLIKRALGIESGSKEPNRQMVENYDAAKLYDLTEAAGIIKRNSADRKFNETVELHVRLGVDPKKSDQN